jgi:hypothetical protein
MVRRARSILVIIVIVHLSLPGEVPGTFVFICTSIVIISRQDLSNVTTRIFVQFLIIAKDYDRDIDGAENGELMRLLEQATFALKECY